MAGGVGERRDRLVHPALEHEHLPEAGAQGGFGRRTGLLGQALTRLGLGIPQPPAPGERRHLLHEDLSAFGIIAIGQPAGAIEEVGGRRRVAAGGVPCNLPQPSDRAALGGPSPQRDVSRDQLRRDTRLGEHARGLVVQCRTHGRGHVVVDRLTHEIVLEPEAVAVDAQEPGPYRLVDLGVQ